MGTPLKAWNDNGFALVNGKSLELLAKKSAKKSISLTCKP